VAGELITPQQVADYLQQDVGSIRQDWAESSIRIAVGWLKGRCFFEQWPPSPVPEDLWAWAVELAALVYDNPTLVSSTTVGGQTIAYGAVAARRRQILDEASGVYPRQAGRPIGVFPDSSPLPEHW
jgi:hypothetical protein